MANKYFRSHPVSLAVQAGLLQSRYPEGTCTLHNNILRWRGKIRPSEQSDRYDIEIVYDGRIRPKVILHGDPVAGWNKAGFPHYFKFDKKGRFVELCLHMWFEFSRDSIIADTIIPWTMEWLFFYEIWLATGNWYGGGHVSQRKNPA